LRNPGLDFSFPTERVSFRPAFFSFGAASCLSTFPFLDRCFRPPLMSPPPFEPFHFPSKLSTAACSSSFPSLVFSHVFFFLEYFPPPPYFFSPTFDPLFCCLYFFFFYPTGLRVLHPDREFSLSSKFVQFSMIPGSNDFFFCHPPWLLKGSISLHGLSPMAGRTVVWIAQLKVPRLLGEINFSSSACFKSCSPGPLPKFTSSVGPLFGNVRFHLRSSPPFPHSGFDFFFLQYLEWFFSSSGCLLCQTGLVSPPPTPSFA